ncbi:hypothetical protein HanRHA438_Chr16g0778361 [Helianthus annuus]|uniref:Uncharacterized protein n=1 Tax=Helianthus annuus TaxID=4232 RepID=A0A9K3GZS5_HELAN|nr:hypothetical protein HanXRQr2_Chr16g0769661 [Helianthus annuus]KAJ0444766.1 hypothetical protein HanIR_Chr16g0835421 [Helianthus annuus]KAJ0461993.1 hypothetical protein HanHA89_Chr16g0678501 [Helianthus annuus]KAJ0646263.1 hypothetical protein HanOQP8_Chr16g0633161 [Helianthus annuus]KAJ0822926.1 hypothetical protein HanPSC8_Chr16g0737741 [Helianthus annuus]
MRDIFWRSMGRRKVANTENLTKNCGTELLGERREVKYMGSNLKNDFNVQHHGRQDQEIEMLNVIIAGLVVENEKDNTEKEAMNERMANVEAMLKARFQNV